MAILRLTIIATALLIVSACGGTATEFGGPLADTNSKMAERGTARASVSVEYTGETEFAPLKCNFALDFDADRASATCTPTQPATASRIELRLIDSTTYIRLGDQGWSKKSGEVEQVRDIDPRRLLDALSKDARDVARVGPAKVGRVDTTHYRALVGPDDTVVNLWIDDDGLIRAAHQDRYLSGESDTGLTAVTEFSDFGADLTIEAPSTDEVASEPQRPTCATGAHPFTYEGLLVAFRQAQALDGPVEDRMLACDGNVLTVAVSDGLSCTLHPEPFARASAERHVKRGKVEYSRLNLACATPAGSAKDELAFEIVMATPY